MGETNRGNGFIFFLSPDNYQEGQPNKWWKAHLSIAPSDFDRAWEIMSPMLEERAYNYKIADYEQNVPALAEVRAKIKTLEKRLSETREELSRAQGNEPSIRYLKSIEQEIINLIKRSQSVERSILRFMEGMQLTVYIPPNQKDEYLQLFKDIEEKLIEEGIEPGKQHESDRSLSTFTSIRHPGFTYTKASAATSYNPDDVDDPHARLSALSQKIEEEVTIFQNQIDHQLDLLTNAPEGSINNKIREQLHSELITINREFRSLSIDDKNLKFSDYQEIIDKKIENAEKKLQDPGALKSWAKNLALLITGVGTIFSLASIVNKIKTGRFLYFDEKEELFEATTLGQRAMEKQLSEEEVEKTPEDSSNHEIDPDDEVEPPSSPAPD